MYKQNKKKKIKRIHNFYVDFNGRRKSNTWGSKMNAKIIYIIQLIAGERHFTRGHSEHPVTNRVFGMTFCPGQLPLRTPCLFLLMPGERNEHLLLEIRMKRWSEMSLSLKFR
jgi:hypothetical protein